MFDIDWDKLKKKAVEIMDSAAEDLGETLQDAKETGSDLAEKVANTTKEVTKKFCVSVLSSNLDNGTKSKINNVLKSTNDICDSVVDKIHKQKIYMEHKIIMMGGRRSGKSTILSSILYQLRENTPGTICTITDSSDYGQTIQDMNDNTIPLPTLDIKRRELKHYIEKRKPNTEFLVDMTPTKGEGRYTLEVSSGNTAINLVFIDVPGEWMCPEIGHGFQRLTKCVEESDVFVIAIDTPFMMNAEENVNEVYNRIYEIENIMGHMKINTEHDLKRIILCPIKCEKWINAGKSDEIVNKVCKIYKNLINRWVSCPEVTIQILPILTVGGIEASSLKKAKLYFKDDDDRTGISCSENILTNTLTDKDGNVIRKTKTGFVEDDKSWFIDYTDIPISWYKLNGKGFCPQFCEQPGYHILSFLVNKEENIRIARAKAEGDNLGEKNFLTRWLIKLFNPTFGKYLPIWKQTIDEMNRQGLLKTEGNGFCFIKKKIE